MKHHLGGIGQVRVLNTDGHSIGIDIGATAVRAAILLPTVHDGRPSVTVHGVGQQPLRPGSVVNGVVIDQAAVTKALKDLWRANGFGCRNVILGVTNQQIVVRDLQMPDLPPDQLAKALPFRAREVVALPIEQALIDFIPLGGLDPDSGTQGGLLIAAPREPVVAAVRAVERARLTVARVDLSSLAVLRSIAQEGLTVEAVVDLGAHLTNIVIHNYGIPKVVRTVTLGGEGLTARVADRADLSVRDAERAKLENGLTGSDTAVVRALSEGVRPLIAEIRSSIQYFSSTSEGARVDRISLTGGTSGLGGFADLLSDEMGVPVAVVEPMQHLSNRAPQQFKHEAEDGRSDAVSLGLAMGAAA